jgi:ribosomal-protein-alanine N-acetyltransferase
LAFLPSMFSHQCMTFAVLYRWKIKSGREAEFTAAWSAGTKLIHEHCGSHGACLHDAGDSMFWSYARWPSEQSRSACGATGVRENACFAVMQDCIETAFDETRLSVSEDQLAIPKTGVPAPLLSTERLLLRPLVLGDAEQLAPALCDDQNMKYWSRGPLEGVDEVRDYLKHQIDPPAAVCFAFALQETPDMALGWVILMDRKPKVAEIGYMLRPDAQGHGYAREASEAAVAHGFSARKLRRIYADADPENAASIKLMKSLGFQYEGCHRAQWETHLGVRDSVIYARLDTD